MSDLPDPAALPVACELSGEDFQRRLDVMRELAAGVRARQELSDGVELTFDGDDEWFEQLADFVRVERRCCATVRYSLIAEPDNGAVRLRLTGGPEVKALVDAMAEAFVQA